MRKKSVVNSPVNPEVREGGEDEAFQTLTNVAGYRSLALLLPVTLPIYCEEIRGLLYKRVMATYATMATPEKPQ